MIRIFVYFEKSEEHVWVAEGHQTKGQEGWKSSVKHSRAHGVEGLLGPLLPVPLLGDDVGHAYMGGVVEGEAHREDQYDGGWDLYGETHEVGSSCYLQQSQGNAEEDKETYNQVRD